MKSYEWENKTGARFRAEPNGLWRRKEDKTGWWRGGMFEIHAARELLRLAEENEELRTEPARGPSSAALRREAALELVANGHEPGRAVELVEELEAALEDHQVTRIEELEGAIRTHRDESRRMASHRRWENRDLYACLFEEDDS